MGLLNNTLEMIEPLYDETVKTAWGRLDNLAKPIGSLGVLEEIAARITGITGKLHNEINKKSIIIMCADNGVVEEGVSACPQVITQVVTNNFTRGITGVCVLAKQNNSDICIVDIGINGEMKNPMVINKKIANGTKNMAKEAAMSRENAVKAIEVGIEMVDKLVAEGCNLLGTGEMGIGNTSTSSAVLSALSELSCEVVVGKGAGLTEEQYENKINVVRKSIEINKPNKDDVIEVLSKVGGFDIAGLCGCFLGAAKNRIPIVIDGFISSTAALCAVKLNPAVKEYLFASHLSAEPGALYIMKEIGLEPMVNLKMRLGEGSGCPIAFNIIEASLYMMNNMATFEEATIVKDFYVDIR